jgi:LysM domain
MSLRFIIRLLAALGVIAIMVFTGLLAYHVTVAPLGGLFKKIIPNPVDTVSDQPDADFAKMLDSAELPDVDPGEKAFQKAQELLALGKLTEAREKLTTIITTFPTSSSAPQARHIVGEMNLDEILDTAHQAGKQVHVVKRGNSFFGIAAEHQTNIDCIMHLNDMLELKGIQPGDELVVMPLNFRILIEPQRKALSLWEGERFICEYNILHLSGIGLATAKPSQIGSKAAELAGKRVLPQSKDYRSAAKLIHFGKPAHQILGFDDSESDAPHGIVLSSQDMEEVSLLTRVGNEVEIRNPPSR